MTRFLSVPPDDGLCDFARCSHDQKCGEDGDDQIGDDLRTDDAPRFHESHCRRNEHQRHDLNEEDGGVFDIVQLEKSRLQTDEHQRKSPDTRRNGERNQQVEQFSRKGENQDDSELFEILHLIFLLFRLVLPIILRRMPDVKGFGRKPSGYTKFLPKVKCALTCGVLVR